MTYSDENKVDGIVLVSEDAEEYLIYARFFGRDDYAGGTNEYPSGCKTAYYSWNVGGSNDGRAEAEGGPLMTVTIIPGSTVSGLYQPSNMGSMTHETFKPGARYFDWGSDPKQKWVGAKADANSLCCGGSKEVTVRYRRWKLCEGTTGYIQTNTGYTDWGGDGKHNADVDVGYDDAGYYTQGQTPGFSDIEYWYSQNSPKDNSLHPFIVITEYTY